MAISPLLTFVARAAFQHPQGAREILLPHRADGCHVEYADGGDSAAKLLNSLSALGRNGGL